MTTIIDLPRFDMFDGYETSDWRDVVQVKALTKYLAGHEGFIAGGCFKNLFLGQEVRDVDVFFRSELDWKDAVTHFERSKEYVFEYETERAIGYRNVSTGVVVECINVFFGHPKEILNTFDFTVSKVALVSLGKQDYDVIIHPQFFKHLTLRRLVVGPMMYNPINTFERSLKYTKYGFSLCRESKVNLLAAIQAADIDPNNLSSSIYNGLD